MNNEKEFNCHIKNEMLGFLLSNSIFYQAEKDHSLVNYPVSVFPSEVLIFILNHLKG